MRTDLDYLADVIRHRAEVAGRLEQIISDLRRRGIDHDLTKFQEEEADIFIGTRERFKKADYGSPEYHALDAEARPAVKHHYAHNRHHVGHYPNGWRGMTLMDLLEMLADWRAAARRSPTLSFKDSLPRARERGGFDDTAWLLLMNTLEYLGWVEEDAPNAE